MNVSLESLIQAWVKTGETVSVWYLAEDGKEVTRRLLAARIVCKDGFSMSVQASETHYCTPRTDDAPEYTHFEVGFPSDLEESLAPYAETPDTTKTVFGWVPLEVIVYLVNKHGGIKEV